VTEEQMQHFLEQNRATNAPRLRFDEGRLQRQIELQSQVAASLATQLETARVDEVNERPRITVIDRATPPVKPLSRRRLLYMLVGAVVGAAIVTAWQQLVERTADRKPHLTAA
jgi:uncharacterized protein involved in exopolysaccharide biosynthesis